MQIKKKVVLSWSGGKDSAYAYYKIQKDENLELIALLTTITSEYDRISMHGIRRSLLESQVKSLGDIQLEEIFISQKATNEEYNLKMEEAITKLQGLNIYSVVFGDIFLEDIRKYREENLSKVGMKAIFPLWNKDTSNLSREFIKLGFKAFITCVDSHFLGKEFVGRHYDEQFLLDLPREIDKCGENGEFHSFVYDGPIFKKEIPFKIGRIVLRENRFYFCDLIDK